MQKYEAMYLVDRIQASTRDWLEGKINNYHYDELRNKYAQEIADLVNTGDKMICIGHLKGNQVYDYRDPDIPLWISTKEAMPLVYIRKD